MNTYNIMISYTGSGFTNIYLPKKGDTTITNGKPVYLIGANAQVLDALRQYREIGINIQIGVSDKGAYQKIDYSELRSNETQVIYNQPRTQKAVLSNDTISSILGNANAPIPVEPVIGSVDAGSYILPSGTYEGKTLKEVYDMGKLKSVYSGFKSRNPEVKKAVEDFYKSITE